MSTGTRAYSKPATTYEEQVARLLGRGLRIDDKAAALTTLERINYYRLSAYWYPFKEPDGKFQTDGSFEKACEFYEFDRAFRLTAMDMVERLEVRIRGAISYHIAHTRPLLA